jgi:hypothetical protein
MGTINLPPVEPQGSRSIEQYVKYLADIVAMQQEEIQNLLEGRLSTVNIREIAGWLVSQLQLMSKDGDVGFSTEDTGGDDIRIWAGDAKEGSPNFVVTKSGIMKAISAFLMSAAGYPRVELNSLDNLLRAMKEPDNYIAIIPNAVDNPAIEFSNGAAYALFGLATLNRLLLTVLSGDLQMSTNNGNIYFSAGGSGKHIRFSNWGNMLNSSTGRTLQQDLDSIYSRLAALEARPIYTLPPTP